MHIMLKNVRIQNFRSLENVDIELGSTNILIGQNNAGKSNFLRAIDVVFNGSKTLSEEDIYREDAEHLSKSKKAIVDIKICPFNGIDIEKTFSDFWTNVFTDKWITIDETNGSYIGIRTIIEYDIRKNDYVVTRKQITEWNDSVENAKVGKKQIFTNDMYDYMNSYYMDAQRDIINDIRDRKSYFGRATSKVDLSESQIEALENKLNSVNQEVIGNIAVITETNESLSKIGATLGSNNSKVQIEPLTRRISDLHKGMDITFKEGETASFSVTQHGMGTRSWISFLTLGAYVDYFHKNIKKADEEVDEEIDDFVLLSLEEPEAHLHPQAQKQIYQQLAGFSGQKIVSTHSSNILAQAELGDIIHFKKIAGKTQGRRFNEKNYSPDEIAKIKREVINTHGELIFSTAIVLCEGITEEQALPIFFKEFFGIEPIFLGINIIGIGGKNYKTYLKFIKEFELQWYIFSDGEEDTIKSVRKAIRVVTQNANDTLENVIIIGNGHDYEKMLIKNGNRAEIVAAINSVNNSESYYDNYIRKLQDEKKPGRRKTDKPPCIMCGQDIYEDIPEDEIAGLDSDERKLYTCMTSDNGKAKYATAVAQYIVKSDDVEKRFPRKILELLIQIEKDFKLKRRSEYNGIEVIKETTGNS